MPSFGGSLPMPIPRAACIAALLLVASPLLEPAGAADWPRDRHGPRPIRDRSTVRAVPPVPPPVLVRGYLPRNHNIPMYNEPPRREPVW
ncbi:hypothetical protein GCM10007890_08920 [Methylobacterium tardum]|jgi:hypothetical protein|uniref:Secreted protein n=2 Tax=Methylobacterium tardum TaxID=374432 RepID=A0AA37TBC5_9HYPH|nr:hypothetical protein GCM10007890_08920 [Methylobacterium tardum]